jgi:uncharacterized membrane protein YhaH (DUF805 family)
MSFYEAIASCFSKYADFNGRATRSEYWWFFLFITLASCGAVVIDTTLYYLFSIGTLLPLLAAGARRLHDTNRSGWWQLLGLVPFGIIVVIIFLAQQSRPATAETQSVTQ